MITDQFNHAISYVKCHNSPTSFRSVPQNITSPFGVDFLRNGTEPDVKSIWETDYITGQLGQSYYQWVITSLTDHIYIMLLIFILPVMTMENWIHECMVNVLVCQLWTLVYQTVLLTSVHLESDICHPRHLNSYIISPNSVCRTREIWRPLKKN